MDEPTRHDEMRESVIAFHKKHPEIWKLFDRFTREKIKAGFEHYSVKAIFERIRWEVDVTYNKDQFKLNNNHPAFYARAWMRANKKHSGFFRTRAQTSRDTPAANRPELLPKDFPTYPQMGEQVAL